MEKVMLYGIIYKNREKMATLEIRCQFDRVWAIYREINLRQNLVVNEAHIPLETHKAEEELWEAEEVDLWEYKLKIEYMWRHRTAYFTVEIYREEKNFIDLKCKKEFEAQIPKECYKAWCLTKPRRGRCREAVRDVRELVPENEIML